MIKRTFVVQDAHSPFHDKVLWKLIIRFIKDLKLTIHDEIVLAGDMADFWSNSSFDKSSKRIKEDVQYEREVFVEFLREIREAAGKKCRIILLKGNHEERWFRWLSNGELKKLQNVPELGFKTFFGLDRYDIEFRLEYKPNPKFLIKHGDYCPKYPARKELDEQLISGSSGHAHRVDRAYRHAHGNKQYIWYSCGHTADKSQIDEACKFSIPAKWQQTIQLLLTDLKNRTWDFEVMHCDRIGFYSKYLRKQYRRNK